MNSLLSWIFFGLISLRDNASVNGWTHTTSGSFKIVGIPGTGTQYFPESYVPSLQRWRLQTNRKNDGLEEIHQLEAWTTCPVTEGVAAHGNEVSENTRILVKPTMDFLIKSGQPSYVMAGLEVSCLDHPLLAHQWVSFATAVEPNFRLLLFQGVADGTDDRLALVGADEIRLAVERLGVMLSQSDDDLFKGFHVVSVPLVEDWIVLPPAEAPQFEDHDRLVVSCLLTAEPDAREIFTLDEYLVEMTATSFLQARLSQLSTACGHGILHCK